MHSGTSEALAAVRGLVDTHNHAHQRSALKLSSMARNQERVAPSGDEGLAMSTVLAVNEDDWATVLSFAKEANAQRAQTGGRGPAVVPGLGIHPW